MVVIAKHHKLGGLKQHTFIPFQSWKSEHQNQSHWAEIKGLAGCAPSRDPRGECFALLFPASRAAFLTSLLVAPSFLPHLPPLLSQISLKY